MSANIPADLKYAKTHEWVRVNGDLATVGITDWIDWGRHLHPARGRVIDVPYLRALPTSERTLATALKDSGYSTWHIGKWHPGGAGSLPQDPGSAVNI